jgi:predicted site-specific integrase-resolvase
MHNSRHRPYLKKKRWGKRRNNHQHTTQKLHSQMQYWKERRNAHLIEVVNEMESKPAVERKNHTEVVKDIKLKLTAKRTKIVGDMKNEMKSLLAAERKNHTEVVNEINSKLTAQRTKITQKHTTCKLKDKVDIVLMGQAAQSRNLPDLSDTILSHTRIA